MDVGGFLSSIMLAQLGGGVLAGIAVGYAVKRVTKLILFLLGLLILILYGLMKSDYITIHWGAVSQGLEQGSHTLTGVMAGLVKDLSASLVGFAGGFYIGVKLR